MLRLLIEELVGDFSVLEQLVYVKEAFNFCFGIFNRVRSVHKIACNSNRQVAADRSCVGFVPLCWSKEDTDGAHCLHTLECHRNHGRTHHELLDVRIERLVRDVCVVRIENSVAQLDHLHADNLQALALKAMNNLPNQIALQRVRFNENQGALNLCHTNLGFHDSTSVCKRREPWLAAGREQTDVSVKISAKDGRADRA